MSPCPGASSHLSPLTTGRIVCVRAVPRKRLREEPDAHSLLANETHLMRAAVVRDGRDRDGCLSCANRLEQSSRPGANRATTSFYPGLERVNVARSVRAELLLAQIQAAIEHQSSPRRPWQRYEPLSAFLDGDIWPTDETVLMDLSFAKLALEMLSDRQRADLEVAIGR